MRPRAALAAMLAGLLTGGSIIASGATPAHARPAPVELRAVKAGAGLSLRLAPPVVTVGEPAALVAQLGRARGGRSLRVEAKAGNTWTEIGRATTDGTGRAVVPLDTSVAGSQVLRVVSKAQSNLHRQTSAEVTLKALSEDACTPRVALVDPAATPAARCLATRLDRWRSAGLMGVGQQLNVSSRNYLAPLTALGAGRVSVVGFDLEELAKTGTYQFPFLDEVIADLVTLANQGAVLNASWHATNPHSAGPHSDRGWHDISALLDPSTPQYTRFWADFDAKLALLERLQDAGVAVVFRPFHEANGGWFWWGHPQPTTYKKLWALMQQRTWAADVHNVVWGYAFGARTWSGVGAPERLLPTRVDLAGIDSYDPEAATADAMDRLNLTGYTAVARRVQRMAFTEVGPEKSADGAWNPTVLSRAAGTVTPRPAWAMLWFDDAAGRKQISSLTGGRTWLSSCPNALCVVR